MPLASSFSMLSATVIKPM